MEGPLFVRGKVDKTLINGMAKVEKNDDCSVNARYGTDRKVGEFARRHRLRDEGFASKRSQKSKSQDPPTKAQDKCGQKVLKADLTLKKFIFGAIVPK